VRSAPFVSRDLTEASRFTDLREAALTSLSCRPLARIIHERYGLAA
jgi:hypothetical protein